MQERNITISSADRDQLLSLINSALLDSRIPEASLRALEGELARASVVPADELPADVIAMHSTATFEDLATGEEESYTLVYPREADVARDRISVFAPIGTALLGYRVGDVVQWNVPAGNRQLKITGVQSAAELAVAE